MTTLSLAGTPSPWAPGEGYRSMALSVPGTGQTGFTLLTATETGLAFTNFLSDQAASENQIRLIGSGVALGDADGDGWCDIYLCGLEGTNALYRNLGGWRFMDITAEAGVACQGQYSTGCALADIDGDGDVDLLVNAMGGGTRAFVNDGHGRFAESAQSGLLRQFTGTTLTLGDADNDGDLDLYVANYRTTTIRSTGLSVLSVGGKRVLRPEDRDQYELTPGGLVVEHAEPDAFYLNDGQGHFAQVPWSSGRFLDGAGRPLPRGDRDWGLSALLRDLNDDGAPDLFVCNDFGSPDQVWINDGTGHFRPIPRLALRKTCAFSMGLDVADVNRDGFDDIFSLDMLSWDHGRRLRQLAMVEGNVYGIGQIDDWPQTERNTLQLNRGDGTYAEIAQLSGVQASDWSWGVAFVDVDLDGFEDMLIVTGHEFDTQDSDAEMRIVAMGPLPGSKIHTKLLSYPRLRISNVAFRNQGDLTFQNVSAAWGFDTVGVSQGLALGDLDNDGDLDVVVNNLNDAAGLYRNNTAAPRVAVRLKGRGPNTHGVGARLRFLGGPVPQSQQVVCGGRYLSCDFPERVFAVGNAPGELSLEVRWRSGRSSLVSKVMPNRRYEISEEAAADAPAPATPPPRQAPAPLFAEVASFRHVHAEAAYDDFARQSLLPRRLSQFGPGVAWCDVDSDGWEDLLVASGRGGSLGLFRNRGNGALDSLATVRFLGVAKDDQTTIIGWPTGTGGSSFWVGQASYESGQTNTPSALRCELWAGGLQTKESIPGDASSAGPLAVADVDGDGELDLFVGGRFVPGRYPEAAISRLYVKRGREYQLAARWPQLALVGGATFSDLNGDGYPDLILACEWGPIRVLLNRQGVLAEATDTLGLKPYLGWWNGVATGDFDGDGRLDIVASNWGRNHFYQLYCKHPVRLYHGDWAGRGTLELIEAYTDLARNKVVPRRDLAALGAALPWLRERFKTYQSFSEASLEEILGDRFPNAPVVEVNWLDSTLFLNRGDHFEPKSLPIEAQWTPAFGLTVADYNGDGHEDLFLSQNFFAVERQTSRCDAGRGLLLLGDGQGRLVPAKSSESGICVYGEQRGCAACDYDADGRVDLVVTQNGAATRLFRNQQGKPGLRVRLEGPEGNPAGFGAVLRVAAAGHLGPAREVRAGSGYWSQDSPVQVLALPAGAAQLKVRWPGGAEQTVELPNGAREVAVDLSGRVQSVR